MGPGRQARLRRLRHPREPRALHRARAGLAEVFYPGLAHPVDPGAGVHGRRPARHRARRSRPTGSPTRTRARPTTGGSSAPTSPTRARHGAGQGPVRGARRRRPRPRDRVRPAALRRRGRRRRLDPRPRLLAHDAHIASRARRRPSLTRTSSGYKGRERGHAAGAHLRRAAARQRRPAGPHPPHGPRGAADLVLALALRPRRQPALATAEAPLDSGLGRDRRRLPPGLAGLSEHAPADSRRGPADLRRLRDEPARAEGPRGQGRPGRVHHQPPATSATSSGRGTSTTSPRACSPRGTRAAAGRALDQLLDEGMAGDGLRSCSPTSSAARPGHASAPARRQAARRPQARPPPERIAGLVCAADLARRKGAAAKAKRYEQTADRWQRAIAPTSENVLDLARLGVKRADDPAMVKAAPGAQAVPFRPVEYGEKARRVTSCSPRGAPREHRSEHDGFRRHGCQHARRAQPRPHTCSPGLTHSWSGSRGRSRPVLRSSCRSRRRALRSAAG